MENTVKRAIVEIILDSDELSVQITNTDHISRADIIKALLCVCSKLDEANILNEILEEIIEEENEKECQEEDFGSTIN